MFTAVRLVALMLALVVIGSALAYLVTGRPEHWVRARRTFIITIVSAFVFFAVMIVQNLLWPGGFSRRAPVVGATVPAQPAVPPAAPARPHSQ